MYEFDRGHNIVLRTISSVATFLQANIIVLYDNGKFGYPVLQLTSSGSRGVVSDTTELLPRPGRVVGARVTTAGVVVKRGQVYVSLRLGLPPDLRFTPLCSGYLQGERMLGLGIFEHPLEGKGFLQAETIADDVAGDSNTTYTPATANTRRVFHGVAWYYHSSGDSASRVLNVQMRRPWGALPTGGTAGTIDKIFDITGPTLIANEEGGFFLYNPERGDGYFITNDNGTVTRLATDANPIPFPFLLTEDDPLTIILGITDGHANDRYSAFALVEEWIET